MNRRRYSRDSFEVQAPRETPSFSENCRGYPGRQCTFRSSEWLLSDVFTGPFWGVSLNAGFHHFFPATHRLPLCNGWRACFRSSLKVSTGGGLLLLHRFGCRHLMMGVFFHIDTLQKFVFSPGTNSTTLAPHAHAFKRSLALQVSRSSVEPSSVVRSSGT